jgi:hypothetical protein
MLFQGHFKNGLKKGDKVALIPLVIEPGGI